MPTFVKMPRTAGCVSSVRSTNRAASSVAAIVEPCAVSMSTMNCGVPALGKSEKPTNGTSASELATSAAEIASVRRGLPSARCSSGA